MQKLPSQLHNNTSFSQKSQKKTTCKTTIKSAVLMMSSTLLLSISAHALEPVTPTDANVINNTSINTSAINLAIMTDNPTVLSETKRITRAKTNTLTSTTNKAKTDQAIYSEDAIHHPVWAKNGMVATQEAQVL